MSDLPRLNGAIRALEQGKPAFVTFSAAEIGAAQAIGAAPYDAAVFEMEHNPFDVRLLRDCMQYMLDRRQIVQSKTLAPAVAPMVRIPPNGGEMNQWVAKQVLDIGVYGVIWPHVSTVEDARNAVAACRYPPKGMRSNGPNRVLLYAGSDYQKHANDEVICAAMVETAEGIEKLDEIASTPGLDAIYIGPTDLALALGLPPIMDNDDPKHIATVNRILEACKRHKIIAGIHTNSAKFTQRYLDQGFQMVMLCPDRNAMMNYVKTEVGKLTGWSPMTPVAPQSQGGY